MFKISHLVLVVMLLPVVAVGQPYWWQPSSFYSEPNKPCTISWVQGENFIAKPMVYTKEQFSSIDQVEDRSQNSVLALWRNGEKEQLIITPNAHGNLLLVAQTEPVVNELSADAFNAFLKEYGQDEIYFKRETAGKLQASGKQLQSHHIKLLLQVGDSHTDVYKKNTGLPLEIIPENNPYELKAGEMMRFKILYNGKPLFGARVKVWNRKDSRTTLQNIYTEKDGTMETRISAGGVWMVSVVHLVPAADKQVEYRSYWSGLVFGLK